MDTLWILAPITSIESIFKVDVLITSINRGDAYNKENLFRCSYEHLTVV